jgi:predicted alpha/beta-fold hydrolase
MAHTALKLTNVGVRTFRLDLRGCGASQRLARKPGHAGRSEDVAAAIEFIAQVCPRSPLVVVGYSLGGNIVLKLLGEWGESPPPQLLRALAIAPPIDLLECSRNMARRGMTMYNRWFVRALLRQMVEQRSFNPELDRLDWTRTPQTLFEFDDRVTAPLSGFTGANEYYACSSAAPRLSEISAPTAILTSADDPIVPVKMFRSVRLSRHTSLHVTQHGGHIGFFGQRGRDPDRNWLDWRVVEFVTGRPAEEGKMEAGT